MRAGLQFVSETALLSVCDHLHASQAQDTQLSRPILCPPLKLPLYCFNYRTVYHCTSPSHATQLLQLYTTAIHNDIYLKTIQILHDMRMGPSESKIGKAVWIFACFQTKLLDGCYSVIHNASHLRSPLQIFHCNF